MTANILERSEICPVKNQAIRSSRMYYCHVVNWHTVGVVLLSTTCVAVAVKPMDCSSTENDFIVDPRHGRVMCRTECPPVKTGAGNLEYCINNCPRKLLPSKDWLFSIRLSNHYIDACKQYIEVS